MSTKISHQITKIAAVVLVALVLGAGAVEAKGKKKAAAEAGSAAVLIRPVASIPGPKRTVAVAPFGTKSNFDVQYGLTDVGGGLAAMLTTALTESGQFLVVERNRLSNVLSEQDLAASGLVQAEGAPQIGQFLGAQLLVMGEVTKFSIAKNGKGMSFGIGRNGRSLGLAPKSQTGVVGIDIRVVDTTTSQVIAAYSVNETMKSRGLAITVSDGTLSAGFNEFLQTPVGQAARAAITTAVERFAEEAARQTWSGNVVDFEAGDLAINAGAASGVAVGDVFEIYRISKVLTDPTSGAVLGERKRILGNVVIETVDDNVAFGRYEPLRDAVPERGDLVVQR